MNKKQIELHKDTILWFCENPSLGVWSKHEDLNEWTLSFSPSFFTVCIYVQNDQFAEIRKAQADSEPIQMKYTSEIHWSDWGQNTIREIHSGCRCQYRIKPSEPVYEVGDWMKHQDGHIFQADEKFPKDSNELIGDFKLWEPTKGELIARKEIFDRWIIEPYSNNMKGSNIKPLEFIITLRDKG